MPSRSIVTPSASTSWSKWGTVPRSSSAGGYHHHIGLNTWESRGGEPPAPGTTGLYHFAILYPSRLELARALKRLVDYGVPIDGASDHGVSEAIYLRDPDGNGIEIYRDRPRDEWPRDPDGSFTMMTAPLDLRSALARARRVGKCHEIGSLQPGKLADASSTVGDGSLEATAPERIIGRDVDDDFWMVRWPICGST